jgi:phosphatidylglycerophosphatase A
MRQIFGELPEGMSFWHPAALIATWFGAGLLPVGPGTWGSAAALLWAWAILAFGGPWALALATVCVFAAGLWAAGVFAKALNAEDPPEIVVDEVCAQWLVLLVTPPTLLGFLAAFAVFRIFDTAKVWPANWADRTLHGPAGIMLDDAIAGLYAALAMTFLVEGGFL